MVNVNDTVIFVVSEGVKKLAIVSEVWNEQCVNLHVEDGTSPTSVLHRSYFGTSEPTGWYWIERDSE